VSSTPEFIGVWKPRQRDPVSLPDNLSREVMRLVWWLEDIGCVRSPFTSHAACLDIPGIRQADMCGRCRALRRYSSPIEDTEA